MKDFISVIRGLFRCGFRSLIQHSLMGLVSMIFLVSPVNAVDLHDELSYDDVLVEFKPPIAPTDREVICLAKNIYFEARGESYLGQKAVAFVTINRVNSGIFPNNICEVVYQRQASNCQFNWACKKNTKIADTEAFEQAKQLAVNVITTYSRAPDPSRGALYFHTKAINTPTRSSRTTATIGQHRFYK